MCLNSSRVVDLLRICLIMHLTGWAFTFPKKSVFAFSSMTSAARHENLDGTNQEDHLTLGLFARLLMLLAGFQFVVREDVKNAGRHYELVDPVLQASNVAGLTDVGGARLVGELDVVVVNLGRMPSASTPGSLGFQAIGELLRKRFNLGFETSVWKSVHHRLPRWQQNVFKNTIVAIGRSKACDVQVSLRELRERQVFFNFSAVSFFSLVWVAWAEVSGCSWSKLARERYSSGDNFTAALVSRASSLNFCVPGVARCATRGRCWLARRLP